MPLIDSKITMKLSAQEKEEIKAELGKLISTLNKSETYLMVSIGDGYDLKICFPFSRLMRQAALLL